MYDNIKIIGGPLTVATDAEVDEAEANLSTRFPSGYREYVTRFGRGVLGGVFVRIYSPSTIGSGEDSPEEWHKRIDQYWFWDNSPDIMVKAQALECIKIGDTVNGDQIMFHPNTPDRIYVLPIDYETIMIAGEGLPDAIEWLCGSGVVTEAFKERNFEPVERPKKKPAKKKASKNTPKKEE